MVQSDERNLIHTWGYIYPVYLNRSTYTPDSYSVPIPASIIISFSKYYACFTLQKAAKILDSDTPGVDKQAMLDWMHINHPKIPIRTGARRDEIAKKVKKAQPECTSLFS